MTIPSDMGISKTVKRTITNWIKPSQRKVLVIFAKGWLYSSKIKDWVKQKNSRLGYTVLSASALLLYALISILVYPTLQDMLESRFLTEQSTEVFRHLIQNVGMVLTGAVTIVVPVIVFAIQVSIDRVPHRLFLQISTNKNLIGSFGLAFTLAIGITMLPTFANRPSMAFLVLSTVGTILLILFLFLHCYRQALFLINPLKQLDMLAQNIQKDFRKWGRRADIAAIVVLFEQEQEGAVADVPATATLSSHDLARKVFFQKNTHWTNVSEKAIQHAMSFARRYAESGDYEVSDKAFSSIFDMNIAYIKAKGKTFQVYNLLIDIPQITDKFIMFVLDQLRQNAQHGFFRRDEEQIKQTLRAMEGLSEVYLSIDYAGPRSSKTHANLAASHLASTVESALPHNMPDILLEGQKLIGQSAQALLSHEDLIATIMLSGKIRNIALSGCIKENYQSAIINGLMILATLSSLLFRSGNFDVCYAAMKIHQDFAAIAKGVFHNISDTPMGNGHQWFLGPLYSVSNTQSLRVQFDLLKSVVIKAVPNSRVALAIIQNIEKWVDGIMQTERNLLLESIKAKSLFTSDMIDWIAYLAIAILRVSNAPACRGRLDIQEKLKKHAGQIINTLSLIPDDKDTKDFIGTQQVTELLFDVADRAHDLDHEDVAQKAGKVLLSWAFRYGGNEDRWNTMGRGLFGAALLALRGGDKQITNFINAVKDRLSGDSAPRQGDCDQAAEYITNRLSSPTCWEGNWSSKIDEGVGRTDPGKLRPIMTEVAQLLRNTPL